LAFKAKVALTVVHNWFAGLRHRFSNADRAAGYRDEPSILQAGFARTEAFDRPLAGCHLIGRRSSAGFSAISAPASLRRTDTEA
jgi:hypothetical protein